MYAVEYDEWGDVSNFILDDDSLTEVYAMDIVRGRILRGEKRPFHKKAKTCDHKCRQRAKELGAPAENIALLLEEMMEQAAFSGCYWCGEPFAVKEEMTVDHKVEMRYGGPHSARNVVIACHACNALRAEFKELSLLDPLCIPYNPIGELRLVPQPI